MARNEVLDRAKMAKQPFGSTAIALVRIVASAWPAKPRADFFGGA